MLPVDQIVVVPDREKSQLTISSKCRIKRTRKSQHDNHDAKLINSVCNKLLGIDTVSLFAVNCESILTDWITLLQATTLPCDIPSADPRIISAFKKVDEVIEGQRGTYLMRRLAFVQLVRVFKSVEASIASDRKEGRSRRKPRYRDASVAIDIYMGAQDGYQGKRATRQDLLERKRAGKSWFELSGPCPLLVLVYSEAAEPIMSVSPLSAVTF